MSSYTTVQGDTWDLISYKIFGEERYMKCLIEANWDYADVLVFTSGIALAIPDVPGDIDTDVPFWREDDANADYDMYEE